MINPSKNDFQAVADWLGMPIDCNSSDVPFTPSFDHPAGRPWQPHLPGADCFQLIAALDFDTVRWGSKTVWGGAYAHQIASKSVEHDGTNESKAAALASAVFQCAVRVAMEAKR